MAEVMSRPAPGGRYQAYGLAYGFEPLTICFVLAGWSMKGFPDSRLETCRFKPLGAEGDGHGECSITPVFGGGAARSGHGRRDRRSRAV